MEIGDIEQALSVATERLTAAIRALAPKHKGGEMEEWVTANGEVLTLERALAKAKGEQYADLSDFPVQWDAGAPLPHVVANDHKIFLIFYVSENDTNWDGTYVTVKNPADGLVESLALVEFVRCTSFRMGTPNDEVFEGHPLAGKGLKGYTAQVCKELTMDS